VGGGRVALANIDKLCWSGCRGDPCCDLVCTITIQGDRQIRFPFASEVPGRKILPLQVEKLTAPWKVPVPLKSAITTANGWWPTG